MPEHYDAMEKRLKFEIAGWKSKYAAAVNALRHIAIEDDDDCRHANDPKAMIRIARDALEDLGE